MAKELNSQLEKQKGKQPNSVQYQYEITGINMYFNLH